ncbi:MAG: hypothetical protein R2695_16000 [Acidimicrobiales bacterium]
MPEATATGRNDRRWERSRVDSRTAVVTSDNPGARPLTPSSRASWRACRPPDLVEPDRRAAIRHALADARQGDVVLIAGKGHESTQTIGAEVFEFDDRDVARDELRRRREKDS